MLMSSWSCVPDITLQWLIQHSRTRRSWGGGSGIGLEEPHHVINRILGALDFALNKCICPSLCSYKLIHIIWTLIFTFTWMCFFYGSSWRASLARFILRVCSNLDSTPSVGTGALWSRDFGRLCRHLILACQRCENIPYALWSFTGRIRWCTLLFCD